MTNAREIAEEGLILLSTVGSTAHGLNLPGTDDHDEMGVCIEPPSHVVGLDLFEQDVFRTKPQGVRSEYGDTDRTIYSARKFCRLALGGNPSILTLLYVKPDFCNEFGQGLLDLASAFSARSAGRAFLGYATQQRQRLLGERGQMNVKRPELVETHGYDCYLDDTEFLTTRGWSLYDDVDDSDCLAAVDQQGALSWEQPFARVEREYEGPIHHFEHRYLNCAVTPNHRMLAAPIRSRGTRRLRRTDQWQFIRADQMTDHGDWFMRSHPTRSAYTADSQDESLIMVSAAYITEGHVAKRLSDGTPSVLAFTQHPDGGLIPYLKQIQQRWQLRRFDSNRGSHVYTLANRALARQVVDDCGVGSSNKQLPRWSFQLPEHQARLMLDVLLAGDGTEHRSGGHVYYTQSKKLAGDVQALALVAGLCAVQWGPYSGMYHVRIQDRWPLVAMRPRKQSGTEYARGRVVCFSVPSETLITRRSGHVALQGNTKYAMHMLRLGFQGIEFLETGKLTLPMPEAEREFVFQTRQGIIDLNTVLTVAGENERRIEDLLDTSPLPPQADREMVNEWLVEAYTQAWGLSRVEAID